MRNSLMAWILASLFIFLSGCLDVTDAPIPPECPLFTGELKAAVGHSYAQGVKPNNDLFMKPRNFYILDDSRVYMFTYNDFAKANPALQKRFESARAVLNLDYDVETSFVLMFDMHVTSANVLKAKRTDHYGTLYFIVGTVQNDELDGTNRVERFKLQGIGGSFDGFYTYETPRDNAAVVAPWVSITGDGKIMYDRKTGEPTCMQLKGVINGVIPGQAIFEFPFKTKLCDC